MNLLQQLMAAQQLAPQERNVVQRKQQRSANFLRAVQFTKEARRERSLQAYREAMYGKGWVSQSYIEMYLGFGKNGATAFLKRLVNDLKLVEKRHKGNAKDFKRVEGYEYKWIGD